jgi:hypothetical protein
MRKELYDNRNQALTLADIAKREGSQGVLEILGFESRLVPTVVEDVSWHAEHGSDEKEPNHRFDELEVESDADPVDTQISLSHLLTTAAAACSSLTIRMLLESDLSIYRHYQKVKRLP